MRKEHANNRLIKTNLLTKWRLLHSDYSWDNKSYDVPNSRDGTIVKTFKLFISSTKERGLINKLHEGV